MQQGNQVLKNLQRMSESRPSIWLKAILPPVVLILALALTVTLVKLRPEQEKKEPVKILPKVEVHTVQVVQRPLYIESQGTVEPRTITRMTGRVSGHIERVSPQFHAGGSFRKGDILIELDPLPYRSAVAEARSRLALAEATLLQEQEAAKQAKADWESMGTGEPGPLVLRIPQLMKAEAGMEAAATALEVAEENLKYTKIKAPYNGRVDRKFVDVGQAITAQATILGEIHASDALEVTVPISLDELSFLNTEESPSAVLSAVIAGKHHAWDAFVERTAASVDPQSRMIDIIVRKNPPFKSDKGHDLKPGMFVSAKIEGRQLGRMVEVPRDALRPGDVVYRLRDDNRLESVHLDIVYTDAESAIVQTGLNEGDRLCTTPLLFFVEGMQVQVAGEEPTQSEAAEISDSGTNPS